MLVKPLSVFVVDDPGEYEGDCSLFYDTDTNPGDGVCASLGGGCTLIAAMEEANLSAGADTIVFEAQPHPNGCDDVDGESAGGPLTLDGTGYPGLHLDDVLLHAACSIVRGIEIAI